MMCVRESKGYLDVVAAFTSDRGKFQYDRFTKELVQLASKSKEVARMVSQGEECTVISLHVLETLIARYHKGYKASEEWNSALYLAIDTITGRGAFGALNKYIRNMLKEQKRK